MTDFLYTDARWTEHFVEVSDPHKEGHHVRFYFERPWVGLTDDEMLMIYGQDHEGKKYNLGRMVQQALKEKNT